MFGKTKNVHANISVNSIHLINSGFPINFVGNEIENKENIQLTRALILIAIVQSLSASNKIAIVDLDREMQEQLALEYNKILLKKI